jgi:peptidoglycan/LPS O-acetylase OafA/YrhL
LCFAAYLGVFRGVIANKLLTMRWIVTIGGMCYSVYLLHNALLNNILSASSGIAPTGSYTLNVAFQAVVMVPCIILVSVLFFVVIERPCMNKNWPYKLRASLSRRVKLSSSDQSRSG